MIGLLFGLQGQRRFRKAKTPRKDLPCPDMTGIVRDRLEPFQAREASGASRQDGEKGRRESHRAFPLDNRGAHGERTSDQNSPTAVTSPNWESAGLEAKASTPKLKSAVAAHSTTVA